MRVQRRETLQGFSPSLSSQEVSLCGGEERGKSIPGRGNSEGKPSGSGRSWHRLKKSRKSEWQESKEHGGQQLRTEVEREGQPGFAGP